MTSSHHLFEYSYWMFKKCFVKNSEAFQLRICTISYSSLFIFTFIFYRMNWQRLKKKNKSKSKSLPLSLSLSCVLSLSLPLPCLHADAVFSWKGPGTASQNQSMETIWREKKICDWIKAVHMHQVSGVNKNIYSKNDLFKPFTHNLPPQKFCKTYFTSQLLMDMQSELENDFYFHMKNKKRITFSQIFFSTHQNKLVFVTSVTALGRELVTVLGLFLKNFFFLSNFSNFPLNHTHYCFRSTAYTQSLADQRSWETKAFSKPYSSRLRTVILRTVAIEAESSPPSSEWRANYATPREPAKLSLWQGRDSKPLPLVCNNSEPKPQSHSSWP